MIDIKLTFPYTTWPIERQTPGETSIWNEFRFHINSNIKKCDYWFVFNEVVSEEFVQCPKENTFLITGEPSSIRTYGPSFVKQFANVITCQRDITKYHPHVIFSQQGLPWHVGRRMNIDGTDTFTKNYDELKGTQHIKKDKLISVISSNKKMSRGHRSRFEFVERLKDAFGSDIDIFGRGINQIDDKWDAIAPYKYHIVIENDFLNDWWTEKLSDTYLAESFPFYYGCPNLSNYFSPDSFERIDINRFDESIAIIKGEIANDRYKKSSVLLHESKDEYLDRYNLFPMIANYRKKSKVNDRQQLISIKPEKSGRITLYANKLRSLIGWNIINKYNVELC